MKGGNPLGKPPAFGTRPRWVEDAVNALHLGAGVVKHRKQLKVNG